MSYLRYLRLLAYSGVQHILCCFLLGLSSSCFLCAPCCQFLWIVLKRHLHLRNRLLDQGYEKIRLVRSLKKFIFRYQDLVEIYSVSAETMINDALPHSENA